LLCGNALLGYFDIYVRHDGSLLLLAFNLNFWHLTAELSGRADR
jgi:hypothetical protein